MAEVVLTRESRHDLFTREECEQILKNLLGSGKIGTLLDFTIVPELSPIGYLGEYYHLKLSYQIEKVYFMFFTQSLALIHSLNYLITGKQCT